MLATHSQRLGTSDVSAQQLAQASDSPCGFTYLAYSASVCHRTLVTFSPSVRREHPSAQMIDSDRVGESLPSGTPLMA